MLFSPVHGPVRHSDKLMIVGGVARKAGQADMEEARAAARAMGAREIGQGAVAIGGGVIAREGSEGTDGLLEGGRGLRGHGRLAGKQRGVLVKCAKAGQELRVDLPTGEGGARHVLFYAAALMAGGALDPALADLRDAGVAIPPPLAEQGQGVPTLEALRTAFPDAARDALAASLKETAAGDTWERLLAFLRTQSGARSLTPREGTDPDAILSRAEAALAAGDLAGSISEIGGLPAEGQARMPEGVALASRRISAPEAAAALAAELQCGRPDLVLHRGRPSVP